MTMRNLIFTAGLTFGVLAAGGAYATTYVGNESFDGATVDLSITTDGTIGVLEQHDVTDYDIKITDSNGSAELKPDGVDSYVGFYDDSNSNAPTSNANGAFTATSSSISFDFDGVQDGVLFINQTDHEAAFCLQGNDCFDGSGSEIATGSNIDAPSGKFSVAESGEVVIGTAISAAPEPASWMLLILGVGVMGTALRAGRAEGFVGDARLLSRS